jgi:hypothetical protein
VPFSNSLISKALNLKKILKGKRNPELEKAQREREPIRKEKRENLT